MADEKLCLKWNDFQKSFQSSFGELRADIDFSDVTLACEDQSIKAHKVVLSASSPFFKKLLKTHSHPQPLIFMRGIRSSELTAMIDFIYLGEASIFQEQLESFLALAEELELNGLAGSTEQAASEYLVKLTNPTVSSRETTKYPNPTWRQDKSSSQDRHSANFKNIKTTFIPKVEYKTSAFEGMPMKQHSKQTAHIDSATVAALESIMEKRDDGFACNQCEYTTKRKDHMREHVERHVEGLEYPCNSCNKIMRSAYCLIFRFLYFLNFQIECKFTNAC